MYTEELGAARLTHRCRIAAASRACVPACLRAQNDTHGNPFSATSTPFCVIFPADSESDDETVRRAPFSTTPTSFCALFRADAESDDETTRRAPLSTTPTSFCIVFHAGSKTDDETARRA